MQKRQKFYAFIKGVATKSVKPVVMFLLLAPVRAYAEEVNEVKIPQTKKDKAFALITSVAGVKKCFDPSATPLQKALYCSRSCCMIAGFTAGCVSENTQPGTRIHEIATSCCISSWVTYGILLKCDRNKTIIKKGPEL